MSERLSREEYNRAEDITPLTEAEVKLGFQQNNEEILEELEGLAADLETKKGEPDFTPEAAAERKRIYALFRQEGFAFSKAFSEFDRLILIGQPNPTPRQNIERNMGFEKLKLLHEEFKKITNELETSGNTLKSETEYGELLVQATKKVSDLRVQVEEIIRSLEATLTSKDK